MLTDSQHIFETWKFEELKSWRAQETWISYKWFLIYWRKIYLNNQAFTINKNCLER